MKGFIQIVRFLYIEFFWINRFLGKDEKISGIRIIVPTLFFLIISSALYGQGGVVHTRSFMHQNLARTYLLYVPAAYTGQEEWPLVINYHGYNSSPSSQISISEMNIVADTAQFLVAYPQGLIVQNPLGGSGVGWNIPTAGGPQDDVSFTDSLINHIDADFSIDSSRIHATGMSMGGDMAFYLACALPNRIASVGGVAGHMTDSLKIICNPGRSFSTLLIFGTADPIISFQGIPGLFSPVPETPSWWAGHNSCSSDSIVTDLPDIVTQDNSTVTLIEYANCTNNVEVVFYRVNNGGHTWPGGGPVPSFFGNLNMDINASSELLNFFNRNSNPITGIGDIDSDVAQNFQLFPNYPNPFNPATIINYHLSSISNAELKIFNQLGQEIQTLVNSRQPAGIHQIKWDGRDTNGNLMPSGLYYYRLKAGSFVETRKMILLR